MFKLHDEKVHTSKKGKGDVLEIKSIKILDV